MPTHHPLLVYYHIVNTQVSLMKLLTGPELLNWTGKMAVARKATLKVWKEDVRRVRTDLQKISYIRKQKQSLRIVSCDLERITYNFGLQPVSVSNKRILYLCGMIARQLTELENELKLVEQGLHLEALVAL